ncbi:MAG TPA: hypothetical protein VLA59_02455 [Patescibacteria group bacterium]|nr:hypothetical protein [Patescibacteria group bacterium]
MAQKSFAPAAEMQFLPAGAYQPGACNIGPAEIRRRRMAGHAGLVASVALMAVLVAVGAPAVLRLLVVLPATLSASGYLQARMRFCANYGWRGIFNLGEIGDDAEVADRAARAADRRLALRIGLGSLALGVAAAIVAALLPI